MRERAERIDADLAIRTEPGTGTTVRIAVRSQAPAGEVRVLIVDGHTAVRQALAGAFASTTGFRVTGTAASLAQARATLCDVDVAVLAIVLPDGYGADLIDDLRRHSRDARTLVVGSSLEHAEVARAVDRGAAAVLHETASLDEIVGAARRVHAGETLVPLEQVVELLRFARREEDRRRESRARFAQLTRREREVLQLLAEGLSGERIAARLHISPRTQRNHVANILAKLDVHSQLQAVILALRNDVVAMHPAGAGGKRPRRR